VRVLSRGDEDVVAAEGGAHVGDVATACACSPYCLRLPAEWGPQAVCKPLTLVATNGTPPFTAKHVAVMPQEVVDCYNCDRVTHCRRQALLPHASWRKRCPSGSGRCSCSYSPSMGAHHGG
jgi:hypothetical protein